jgi:hypothetical protein
MIRIKMKAVLLLPLLFLGLVSCENAPVSKLVNPTIANTTGTWSGLWVLYDDEIRTGGTVMMFTSMNGIVLDFASRENPHQGTQCVKFSWDGGDVTAYSPYSIEHDFTGFSLIVASSLDKYGIVTKDLTPGGFTKIAFWVRGSLSSNVYLRLESNNGGPATLSGTNAWMSNTTDRRVTGSWQRYEFALAGNFTSVKDFVKIVLKYDEDGDPSTPNVARGNGGIVFLDDIHLER